MDAQEANFTYILVNIKVQMQWQNQTFLLLVISLRDMKQETNVEACLLCLNLRRIFKLFTTFHISLSNMGKCLASLCLHL